MSDTAPHTKAVTANPWRPRLGRRGLILAAMVIIGAGMALNWGWLTAVGAAPLILAVAPCAVMCGLGVCMMCKSNTGDQKSVAAEQSLPKG